MKTFATKTKKNNTNGNGQLKKPKPAQTGTTRPAPVQRAREHIMQLQKTIGNRAVTQMIENGTLHLNVNPNRPGPAHQREIDALAQRVEDSIIDEHSVIQSPPTAKPAPMHPVAQAKGTIQFWSMSGTLKNHIFDGEISGRGLTGLHSQARKNPRNSKLQYEDTGPVKDDKPYSANVRADMSSTRTSDFYPKGTGGPVYKSSDMFPASWDEGTVVGAIEQAYVNKYNWGKRTTKFAGKKLGNAKGIAMVFVGGDTPTTVYPYIT